LPLAVSAHCWTFRAELVVAGALLVVGKYLVGFIYLLEFAVVTLVLVRMMLMCELAEGLLDVILRGTFVNIEDFVVVFHEFGWFFRMVGLID